MTGDLINRGLGGRAVRRRRLLGAAALSATVAAGWRQGGLAAGPGEDAGSLGAMLRLAAMPVGRPAQIATYANVVAQLTAVGVGMAGDRDDDVWPLYLGATSHLAQSPDLINSAFDPAWREAFGFDLGQVTQSLLVGEPPHLTTLLRGRFDFRELSAAWERTGYREVTADDSGFVAYSLYDQPEAHLDSPIVHLSLTNMNNAAPLPDGTLAFSSSLDGIRALLAVDAGQAPSLEAEPTVAALVGALGTDIASAILVEGTLLEQGEAIDQAVEQAAVQQQDPLPPIRLALFAVTVGGPVRPFLIGPEVTPLPLEVGQPEARFRIVLLMGSVAAAADAVGVIEYRLDTGRSVRVERPFAEFFPASGRRVQAVAGRPIVTVDLAIREGVPLALWRDLLFNRDVGFLAW